MIYSNLWVKWRSESTCLDQGAVAEWIAHGAYNVMIVGLTGVTQ